MNGYSMTTMTIGSLVNAQEQFFETQSLMINIHEHHKDNKWKQQCKMKI